VRTLMLEGGGRINGGLLDAGLVDEVSLLLVPVADGRIGAPALFDVDVDDVTPHRLALEQVEQRSSGILWLRYRVEPVQRASGRTRSLRAPVSRSLPAPRSASSVRPTAPTDLDCTDDIAHAVGSTAATNLTLAPIVAPVVVAVPCRRLPSCPCRPCPSPP